MEIFRLKYLRVKENSIFKKEIKFDFSQESDNFSIDAPYITLILGPNGTGKSNLLKFILELFRLAYEKQQESEIMSYPSGKYFFEFALGNDNYTILNTLGWENGNEKPNDVEDEKNEKGIRFWKNGSEISAKHLKIPQSILALSIMLTDKFIFVRNPESYPIYKYLGVRRDNNSAGTKSLIGKTIDNIFHAIHKNDFIGNLKEMLEFLNLKPELHVSYTPRYKKQLFRSDLTAAKLEDFFTNYQKYLPNRKTEPWSVSKFKTLKSTNPVIIDKIVDLIRYLSNRLWNYGNSKAPCFDFDIINIENDALALFPYLTYLHQLDIISYPKIVVVAENETDYFLDESSSGEYHFISTIVGLLATITDNSLVLIDEPEISLHPNWQMKYVAFLNNVFKKYKSAHFIICSHSHFLVSDLKPESSSIISLKKSEGIITSTPITKITFGWSAEEVLYSVFNVRTSRNAYLEFDLTKMVSLINKNSIDFDEIRRIYNKISSLVLSDNDPLNILKEKAELYLNKNNA
jgi:predicted ATPase